MNRETLCKGLEEGGGRTWERWEMNRSSAAEQETLRVRSGLRRSSARQAPISCWRRGGGVPSGVDAWSPCSDREVSGWSASERGRDPGGGAMAT